MRKVSRLLFLFLAILAIIVVAAIKMLHPAVVHAPAEEANAPAPQTSAPQADWNTYHGDSQLRGAVQGNLPDTLAVRWRLKTGAAVREAPVVCGGRIFFSTARGEIIAADLNGGKIWGRELFTGEQFKGAPVRERIDSPVACFGGALFVGTARGMIYCLNADSGADKWTCDIDSPIMGTVNYLPIAGGRVYVIGRAEAVLFCIDANTGKQLWHGEPIDRCDGSPAVSPDAVAFGSCAAALHIFSPESGRLLHSVPIDDDSQIASGVAIDNGRIYAGCRSGKIIEVDIAAGKILWTNSDGTAEVFSTPAVTAEMVVVSSNDGNVYALERATGKTRWRFDTKGNPTSPAIVGDKVAVSADGSLHLLRLSDGAPLCAIKVSDEITAPSVAGDTLIVGSEDGTMVALGAGNDKGEVQK